MQDAAIALLHLLFRAFDTTISRMGTSALAVGIGLTYALAKSLAAYRRGGWDAVRDEAAGGVKSGVLFTLGAWFALFLWFVGATIYQDHTTARNELRLAKSEIAELKKASTTTDEGLRLEIASLKGQMGLRDNTIERLQGQIGNQQTTIATLIAQVSKSILPEQLRPIVLLHNVWPNSRIDPDSAKKPQPMAATQVIVLVNKAVPGPWRAIITTDRQLLREPDLWVLGTGSMMSGGAQFSGTVAELRADSPGITPNTPLMITLYSKENVEKVLFAFR